MGVCSGCSFARILISFRYQPLITGKKHGINIACRKEPSKNKASVRWRQAVKNIRFARRLNPIGRASEHLTCSVIEYAFGLIINSKPQKSFPTIWSQYFCLDGRTCPLASSADLVIELDMVTAGCGFRHNRLAGRIIYTTIVKADEILYLCNSA